jgi:hypothetical protein
LKSLARCIQLLGIKFVETIGPNPLGDFDSGNQVSRIRDFDGRKAHVVVMDLNMEAVLLPPDADSTNSLVSQYRFGVDVRRKIGLIYYQVGKKDVARIANGKLG